MDQGKEIISQKLQGARYLDLLAKTAKASLKDTRRVLLAIEALEYAFDVSPTDDADHCIERPSTTEITACDRVYRAMLEQAAEQPGLRKTLRSIAKIKHMRGERLCEEASFRPAELTARARTA